MECEICGGTAVFLQPPLCKEHFIVRFEERVRSTIADNGLLPSPEASAHASPRICVAVSGGKDSLTTLFVLRRIGYAVEALAIDEGIAGYREHTLEDLRAFCGAHNIPLRIVAFADEVGAPLDAMLADGSRHPCMVCGTYRRALLNKHAQGYDLVATGHNADDEAQSVLMNLLKANSFFARGGPKVGFPGETVPRGFVQRIKPLYGCTEKEVVTYALLNGIRFGFAECPYASRSFRGRIRDALNVYEAQHPGAKRRVLERYLAAREHLHKVTPCIVPCASCGAPSPRGACGACVLTEELAVAGILRR